MAAAGQHSPRVDPSARLDLLPFARNTDESFESFEKAIALLGDLPNVYIGYESQFFSRESMGRNRTHVFNTLMNLRLEAR